VSASRFLRRKIRLPDRLRTRSNGLFPIGEAAWAMRIFPLHLPLRMRRFLHRSERFRNITYRTIPGLKPLEPFDGGTVQRLLSQFWKAAPLFSSLFQASISQSNGTSKKEENRMRRVPSLFARSVPICPLSAFLVQL